MKYTHMIIFRMFLCCNFDLPASFILTLEGISAFAREGFAVMHSHPPRTC